MTQNIFERYKIPGLLEHPVDTDLATRNTEFEGAVADFFRKNFSNLSGITPNWSTGPNDPEIHRDLTIGDMGAHWNREDTGDISLPQTSEETLGRWDEDLFVYTPDWLRTACIGIIENRLPTTTIGLKDGEVESRITGLGGVKKATIELGAELGDEPGIEMVTATYESNRDTWWCSKTTKRAEAYEHQYGYTPTDRELSLLHQAAGLIVSAEIFLQEL